jgi:hypothetical protein
MHLVDDAIGIDKVIRIGNLHLRGSVCGVKTTKGGMKEAKTYRRYLIASNINCLLNQTTLEGSLCFI